MIDWAATGQYVAARIKEAQITERPWPHINVIDIFPQEFYVELLANFPSVAMMEQFAANRYIYWMEKDAPVAAISPFWASVRSLLNEEVRTALQYKLDVVGVGTGSELLYDLPGYTIGPHTDTRVKLVTALFYLPETDKDIKQGTLLMTCSVPDPRGKGHKFTDEYKAARVIPYTPNSALFFVRTDNSYHAVRPTPVERKILAFDIFRDL